MAPTLQDMQDWVFEEVDLDVAKVQKMQYYFYIKGLE